MKLTGYSEFDWESHGFRYGLPPGWMPFPGVEAQILERPGTFPTFGPSQIQELRIPGFFMLVPGHAFASFEEAWAYLFQRLNPYNTIPRQLRGERNNGTKMNILAVIEFTPANTNDEVNTRQISFVAVQPFWSAQVATTSSTVTL